MPGGTGPAVETIAACLGADVSGLGDEHARWAVYRRAMGVPKMWERLADAVREEPDQAVALSVVLCMLERVPTADRERWPQVIASLQKREFAQRRAEELAVLERAMAGADSHEAEWSRWLQERLSERATSVDLLERLAAEGATKRIRRTAAERRRILRTSSMK